MSALALLALAALPARAADNVPYLDAAGNLQHQDGVTEITAATCGTMLTDDWYVVSGVITCNVAITINGNVNLILADDASLSVTGTGGNAGINVTDPNSLTIYAQSTDAHMGSLTANGDTSGAGIGGGTLESNGAITINGGAVTATGGDSGAGIGGGMNGNGGAITIHGGTVTANGGFYSAGIGGGSTGDGGNITIDGGTVTAHGGNSGAGIGGGLYGNGGSITIDGGTVTATGDNGGAGIGGGYGCDGGTTTIDGGTVTATSGGYGAGIGGGGSSAGATPSGASGDISITGSADVTATGGDGGPGVGGGAGIGSGGAVDAVGGLGAISIGTSGAVTATGGSGVVASSQGGAGIGTGGSATVAGAAAQFLVTSSASAHGSVAPLGTVGVAVGGDQTYAITPASGYAAVVTLDGVDVSGAVSGGSYQLTNVTTDHALVVTFAVPHTVTATAGANGAITGPATVLDGDSATYTITPNTGYVVDTLLLDGADAMAQLVGNTLTLDNVTANHAIVVTFVAQHAITATAGANGAITGPATVLDGQSAAYTITPNPGYAVDTLLLDGADATAQLAGNTLTLTNVKADHAIAVTFAVGHAITLTAGANGAITGPASVVDGHSATYAITPNPGYKIDTLLLDGADAMALLSGNTLALANVTANHTIEATFALAPMPPGNDATSVPALGDAGLLLLALLLAGGGAVGMRRGR